MNGLSSLIPFFCIFEIFCDKHILFNNVKTNINLKWCNYGFFLCVCLCVLSWDRVLLYSSDRPWTQPPEYWEYRNVPPHPAQEVSLFFGFFVHVLGELAATEPPTSPALQMHFLATEHYVPSRSSRDVCWRSQFCEGDGNFYLSK